MNDLSRLTNIGWTMTSIASRVCTPSIHGRTFAQTTLAGGGACQLREKVLAEAAKTFILVADYRKNSSILGQSWTAGVPIEVVPFAYATVLNHLNHFEGCIRPKLRMGIAKAGPVVTDNGNFVIDAPFTPEVYAHPQDLLHSLKVIHTPSFAPQRLIHDQMLTGVVEVGLFCGMAQMAYFGTQDGGVMIRSRDVRLSVSSCLKV